MTTPLHPTLAHLLYFLLIGPFTRTWRIERPRVYPVREADNSDCGSDRRDFRAWIATDNQRYET
jgi:hypothetical protein